MAQLANIYIGSKFSTAGDARNFLKDPIDRVPSNYKDPQKIEAKRLEIAADQEADAQRYPMTGVLEEVFVMDDDGNKVFHTANRAEGARGGCAPSFFYWITQQFPEQFADSLRFGDTIPEALFFGFSLKQLFKITAFEIFEYNRARGTGERISVPVRFWVNPQGAYDVRDVMLKTPEEKDIDFNGLLAFFGINAKDTDLVGNPALQAQVARELVTKAQLAPELANVAV